LLKGNTSRPFWGITPKTRKNEGGILCKKLKRCLVEFHGPGGKFWVRTFGDEFGAHKRKFVPEREGGAKTSVELSGPQFGGKKDTKVGVKKTTRFKKDQLGRKVGKKGGDLRQKTHTPNERKPKKKKKKRKGHEVSN